MADLATVFDGSVVGYGKETSKALKANIVDLVLNGEINPLQALAQLKCMIDACEKAVGDIQDSVLAEADKYNEKSFNQFGVKFEKREVGVKYDYSDDAEWQALNREVISATEDRIARESKMKKLGLAHKTSKSSVAVTLL